MTTFENSQSGKPNVTLVSRDVQKFGKKWEVYEESLSDHNGSERIKSAKRRVRITVQNREEACWDLRKSD